MTSFVTGIEQAVWRISASTTPTDELQRRAAARSRALLPLARRVGEGGPKGRMRGPRRREAQHLLSVSLAEYDYLGAGNVVGIEYPQPDVYQRKYGTTAGTWPDLDRFGRVTERLYYCQNWRHDVVALVTNGGLLKEHARCFSYGVPFEIPLGDCDGDGDTDTADQTLGLGTWGTSVPKCDLNLDGTVDGSDNTILLAEVGATAGFGNLGRNRNRFGYAGYCADMAVNADWHIRNRVLVATLGRWSRRDPLGVADGSSMYQAFGSAPIRNGDSDGLISLEFVHPRRNSNPVGEVGNPLNFCDTWNCGAGNVLQLDAAQTGDFVLVAQIRWTLAYQCCQLTEPSLMIRSVVFWEAWDDIVGHAMEQIRLPDHMIGTDDPLCFPFTLDRRIVESVRVNPKRLVESGTGSWSSAETHQSPTLFLDCPEKAMTQWSVDKHTTMTQPEQWTDALEVNLNHHAATVASFGCCSQCSLLSKSRFGSCQPGPAFTKVGDPTLTCP